MTKQQLWETIINRHGRSVFCIPLFLLASLVLKWAGMWSCNVKTTYLIFENFMVITTEAPEPKKNSIQDIPKNNFLRT